MAKDWRENYPVYAEWNDGQFPKRVLEMENPDRITQNNYYVVEYKFWTNIGSFRATGKYPKAFCQSKTEVKKFIEATTGKKAPKGWEDLREFVGAEGFTLERFMAKEWKKMVI